MKEAARLTSARHTRTILKIMEKRKASRLLLAGCLGKTSVNVLAANLSMSEDRRNGFYACKAVSRVYAWELENRLHRMKL